MIDWSEYPIKRNEYTAYLMHVMCQNEVLIHNLQEAIDWALEHEGRVHGASGGE